MGVDVKSVDSEEVEPPPSLEEKVAEVPDDKSIDAILESAGTYVEVDENSYSFGPADYYEEPEVSSQSYFLTQMEEMGLKLLKLEKVSLIVGTHYKDTLTGAIFYLQPCI